jgi:hypothetical protein
VKAIHNWSLKHYLWICESSFEMAQQMTEKFTPNSIIGNISVQEGDQKYQEEMLAV